MKDVDALKTELKLKVICEYKELLNQLSRGKKPDYELILQEISFIDIADEIENPLLALQYYINNKWQTNQY